MGRLEQLDKLGEVYYEEITKIDPKGFVLADLGKTCCRKEGGTVFVKSGLSGFPKFSRGAHDRAVPESHGGESVRALPFVPIARTRCRKHPHPFSFCLRIL